MGIRLSLLGLIGCAVVLVASCGAGSGGGAGGGATTGEPTTATGSAASPDGGGKVPHTTGAGW